MLNEKIMGSIKLIHTLNQEEKNALFDLMQKHYDGVDKKAFLNDLSDKHHIILFYDKEFSLLKGFTTLKILTLNKNDHHICLFSGDTIIDKEYWGSVQLPRLWCVYINKMKEWYPGKKIFWLLTAKGYKTYRFLSVFFRDYYPSFQASSTLKAVLDSYAGQQFQKRYNPTTHLIDEGKLKDRLKPGVADIDLTRHQDPHVDFFIKLNPNWMNGTELASLVDVCDENLTSLGKRMFRQASRTFDVVPRLAHEEMYA